jgi:hypothetical protein
MGLFAPPLRHQRRVVVTGMSVVCPLGIHLPTVWARLTQGATGVVSVRAKMTQFWIRWVFLAIFCCVPDGWYGTS